MSAPLEGKVAFITGVARGQGRAHAVRLARDGADIIGVDICTNLSSMDYPNATVDELDETVKLVEEQGRRIVARQADIRDFAGLSAAFKEGHDEFGRVDIVIANAGITRLTAEVDPLAEWHDIIDTNLTGTFHTIRAALPALRASGRGGSIVITSSSAGLKGVASPHAGLQAYTAAKRGLVGYMQVLANDLAKDWIRVNTIHPTGVATGMVLNEAMEALMAQAPDALSSMQNALPIPMLQAEDIANAVAWLVADEQKYITGIQLPLDAGFTIR